MKILSLLDANLLVSDLSPKAEHSGCQKSVDKKYQGYYAKKKALKPVLLFASLFVGSVASAQVGDCEAFFNKHWKGLSTRKDWVKATCDKKIKKLEMDLAEHRKFRDATYREENRYTEALNSVTDAVSSFTELRNRRAIAAQLCHRSPGNFLWCEREIAILKGETLRVSAALIALTNQIFFLPDSDRKVQLQQTVDRLGPAIGKFIESFSRFKRDGQ